MAMVQTSDKALATLLNRGVVDAVVRADLERMLRSGKPLRIKFGVDPSRPDLHLGHAVGFRKIRQFQELGHHVIVIIGDWTARIGDPSGRSDTRQMLSAEEVHANAQTYLDQMGKIVDVDKIEVAWQTSWFEDFSLEDVVRLCAKYTVNRMLDRDDFSTRYGGGQAVSVVEFLYPLLQAYDSVAIAADVELGGTDQYFNFQVARDIMPAHDLPPQQFLTWPLLVGTDGTRKMSKSYDNYVAITDEPNDMYGKVMSLSDDVMRDYFETLTDIPVGVLDEMFAEMEAERRNPRDVKAHLAREIVTQFHDAASADAAEGRIRAHVPPARAAHRHPGNPPDRRPAGSPDHRGRPHRRQPRPEPLRGPPPRPTRRRPPGQHPHHRHQRALHRQNGANLPSRQAQIRQGG